MLSSPNILPLIGVYVHESSPITVSEWMKNGTIKKYIQQNPHVNKLSLVNFIRSLIFVYLFVDVSGS